MKKLLMLGIVTVLLLLPMALRSVNADSSTNGTVTISATCGLSFTGGAPITFGTLARDITSSEQTLQLNNTGSVISTVTVSAKNWKDGSDIVHIAGNFTKFATTDQGSGLVYASKHALNGTDGAVTFGTVRPPVLNDTYWQLLTTLQNMPFSGNLTQSITFTTLC